MPRTSTKQPAAKKPVSVIAVAVEILARKGSPMKVAELTRAVVKSGRAAGLKGKTPEATVSARLYVAARAGRPVTADGRVLVKTGRGEVALEAPVTPAKRRGRAAAAEAAKA